jgi:hypothetical protein
MIDYKQLVADFASIAYNHQQINSFGFGDLAQCTNDIDTKQAPKYTRAYVVPGDVILAENHLVYNFAYIIMDKVNDDLTNLSDVLSDTLEIAKDIWTILAQSYTQRFGNFSWDIIPDQDPDVISFIERFEDNVAGWTINLSVQIAFDYNSCTPPLTGGYDFPEDQNFDSYKLIIDDFKEFADLHEQINSFGFGDVPQLTNDIISKQEPRYPRMYVTNDLARFHTGDIKIKWKIYFVDKLNDDLSNLTYVLSDTLELVKDLYAKLNLSEYEAEPNAPVQIMYEKTETNLAGWVLDVTIAQKFSYNRCVLPESSFSPHLTWDEINQLWKKVNNEWQNV